jgi:tetratricopeptide (TPR) repeat protein
MAMISRSKNPVMIIGLCLAAVTIATYWPVSRFGFVNYDDPYYVYENPHVSSGLTAQGIVWAFTTHYCSNWHPLTWLSHALDCQLFGLDPRAQHLVNLLLHVANTLLLFQILFRTTAAPWRSAFVAGVFALHPLHVESVAWIAERKDVLSTLFWMLTVWAYVRYVEHFRAVDPQSRKYYRLALLFFALGLASKPMLVTLPFVLLLLDYWPLGRAPQLQMNGLVPLFKEKVPFFVLTILSCAVTFWAQHAGGAVESFERLPVGYRVANATVSYLRYAAKTVWPHRLAVFYPQGLWPMWTIIAAGALLVAVTIWVRASARRQPQFLVGWLWYLGTLVPVIGFVQVGRQSMADRYTYVPMIGLLIMIAWSIPSSIASQPWAKRLFALTAAILLGACVILCRQQISYWQNSETLFRHALTITPSNATALNNLGSALERAGRVKEAFGQFEEAVRLNPGDWRAQFNLGTTLLSLGRIQNAIPHLQRAAEMKPDLPAVRNALGVAFLNAADIEKAKAEFERVLELDPSSADAHYNLGLVLRRMGKTEEAVAHFEKAVQLRPDFTKARDELSPFTIRRQ